MASAVKSVSTPLIGRIISIGEAIYISLRRHCLVKGSIEDGNLRQIREKFFHRPYTHEVRRIM